MGIMWPNSTRSEPKVDWKWFKRGVRWIYKRKHPSTFALRFFIKSLVELRRLDSL